MVANPTWIANNIVQVITITAAVMAFKTIVTIGIFRFSCSSFSIAVASALCLSQIGEFAFVLSSIAYKAHVLPNDLYQLMVSVIIFSIFATPFIVKAAPIIGLKLERYLFKKISDPTTTVSEAQPIDNLVFILGFGPAAREVVKQLKNHKLRIVVIDLSQDSIDKAKEMGLEAHIGDIRQIEVLKAYKVHLAKLVVVTVPGHAAAIQAINNARRLAPHIKVIARSRYHENVNSLVDAGAHEVVNEERGVGEELAKSVKEMLI
jgi:CPA2 family monovalent cation:H+ antiporter-2